MGARYFGAAVRRREDPRFLRGEARYVDDVTLPGMLHAAFLRAPHAHARLARIDTVAAKALAGVAAVFTFDDLARWMKPLPLFGAPPRGVAAAMSWHLGEAAQWARCRDRARYAGEAVVMVAAESRAAAADALGRVEVAWKPLPPVVDMAEAVAPGSPLVHPEWGTNVAIAFTHSIGDPDVAFARADVVVSETLRIQRYVGMPLECRGVVAHWDRRDGTLTTWNSTQVPHFVQAGLTGALGLPPHKIRVIAPDLGGGFGTKASGYAEDALVPIAATVLGRPVKWIEDRREHMSSAAHARHQTHAIQIAATRDGTVLGLTDRISVDLGAYNVWGIVLPYNTVAHLIGPHRIKSMRVDVQGVVTNKTPNAPYRGAGRPEAVFAMDRILDRLGRELTMDPAELRRKNYIRADELPYDPGMPYRDGHPLVYDTGDFPALLEQALAAAGYDAFRREHARPRPRRVYRGLGISGEAAPEDVEIDDGRAFVRGSPQKALDLARVVQASIPTFAAPGVASPDFEATAYHHVPTVTYASAVHVAQVEMDVETGGVKLLRYVVAHDCGKVINPVIVDGQVHGGVAQGVGGALFEDMAYDGEGQLLTGSLMDYAVPKADDLPPIETVHLEFPSPRNPLGAKGLGEGGAISPPAAIANAIEDALAPFDVRITETPVTPARVRALLAGRAP